MTRPDGLLVSLRKFGIRQSSRRSERVPGRLLDPIIDRQVAPLFQTEIATTILAECHVIFRADARHLRGGHCRVRKQDCTHSTSGQVVAEKCPPSHSMLSRPASLARKGPGSPPISGQRPAPQFSAGRARLPDDLDRPAYRDRTDAERESRHLAVLTVLDVDAANVRLEPHLEK